MKNNAATTNLIDAAGYLAVSTRLQRLADQLRKDGALIYSHFGLDFEPKYWPVLYTLSRKSPMGVIDLANEIGYAHPSVIALVREMEQQKWLLTRKDKSDSRRRLLALSPSALELISRMQPVWEIIREALQEICEGPHPLLKAVETVEARVEQESFFNTAMRVARTKAEQAIRIIDWEPRHLEAWKALNLAWIARDFEVEDVDIETLSHPQKYFLEPGGAILLAEKDGEIVGTVAIQPFGERRYEMAKMTVAENLRGLKIGEKLCAAAIERAKLLGAETLFLYSNTKAYQALNLYFKLGFRVTALDANEFKRANIRMDINFDTP